MEVADADIQRQLAKPYTIVFRAGRQDLTTRVEVFSDVLLDRQRARLSGMVEYGHRTSGLLEIRRAWFVKYNKPVYYQPKEFHQFLRKAKNIIIPRKEKPTFTNELKDLLRRLQTVEPRVVPVCEGCMRKEQLTILTRRNAIKVTDDHVACITCARVDFRTDMKSLGIHLSKGMVNHLEKQLASVKSVPRMMGLLTPGFDPVREPELTLIDTLEVEDTKEGRGVNELALPNKLKELLISDGFTKLLPVQEMVVDAGLLDGVGLLIVSSTSSGKTLLAEMAGVPKAMNGAKMLYLSPLVALTNEKYEVFKKRYKSLGLRVGIRVGMSRLAVSKEHPVIVDTRVSGSDIICATYEALDVLLRTGASKELGRIGTIIVDEVQNLADPERGPELDGLLARLRFYAPDAQVIALSATVGSPERLAKDMKLKLVNYVGRPVPLERHLIFARSDVEKRSIIRRLVSNEFRHVSSSGSKGQSIIFTFSRRRAQALGDWLREHHVSSAVYHGGLSYSRRRSIEWSFAKQRYACVVTTAALGAGVDLPASQVIFESLAMGAEWLTTAAFEQMLGRAGRLGKHDRGKVYILVEPERKYHGGQSKTEDEIASELLAGVIEDVEPFADTEACAEQILATICSTGLVELKAVARAYNKMLSRSIPPSDALKHLVRKHMIRVREGGAHPTALGRATSVSFLTPTSGFEVQKQVTSMDVLDIAILLDPFENVYLSPKLQSEVNSAFRTHMPTRLFSGVFADLTDMKQPRGGATRLPKWVFELFGRWTLDFFGCGCRDFPECSHGRIKLGRWIVDARKKGLNPSGIARKLHEKYELWAYPGDLFSWLDTLIHNLRAVQRIAAVAGETDIKEEIEGQISRIERPLDSKTPEQ
ncbi:MAG: DEAD/DEAH box helicase [Candidatus Thorarchaeota archaeon]|nr:DEAD/DEAH box helicase [Candidatus Thorarchaeota archaeon]